MTRFYSLNLRAGCKAVLRMGSIANNKNDGENIAVTDNGNYIVDLFFTEPIVDVALAAKEIKATVGAYSTIPYNTAYTA